MIVGTIQCAALFRPSPVFAPISICFCQQLHSSLSHTPACIHARQPVPVRLLPHICGCQLLPFIRLWMWGAQQASARAPRGGGGGGGGACTYLAVTWASQLHHIPNAVRPELTGPSEEVASLLSTSAHVPPHRCLSQPLEISTFRV